MLMLIFIFSDSVVNYMSYEAGHGGVVFSQMYTRIVLVLVHRKVKNDIIFRGGGWIVVAYLVNF